MRLSIFFFFLGIIVSGYGQSKTLPADVNSFIRQRIEAEMNPSIVVGIIDKNGPQYYAFGKKKHSGKAPDEHTLYEIGSISKVFTGILLADMVIKGELKTDDPIENFLPAGVHAPTYEGEHITLGHLSDHTSSLPREPDNFTFSNPDNPFADYTLQRMYEFLSSYELTRPVGSDYEYSNLGAGLLGNILASKAGQSYEELMVSRIASPLNMDETRIYLNTKLKKCMATGHDGNTPVSNWDLPAFEGAGAIKSSVHDMLIFLAANLQLIDHPLKKAMLLSHMPRHDKEIRVGLGWHISDGSQGDIIWHNGGTGGYSTFAGFVKETGKGVIVMTNSRASVDDIGIHLLDPNVPLPSVFPHISISLKESIDKEGISGLMPMYDKIKKENAGKYDLSEMGLNALGYYYLNRKKIDEAIAVFLLNIREYPESANVYDSYAEALMEKGDKEQAIHNYKKSLEINPGNDNAVMMLAKMGVTVDIPVPEIDTVILESYVGTYELVPGFDIVITRKEDGLIAQATGQSAFPIYPKKEDDFYYKVVNARIVFNKNSAGEIESLTLFQNGREMVGRKKD